MQSQQLEIVRHPTNSRSIFDELWRRGELSWKFRPAQVLIEEAFQQVTKKLFVANCSRRMGKSFWCAIKCLTTAIKRGKRKIKYASAYLKDVEEIIIPLFEIILEDCPDDLRPKWLATKKKFVFSNGSEIQLIGLDRNPNGVRGQFCDLFIFEESGFISDLPYLYSSVVIPLFKGRPGARAIMISTPPRTPAHPFQVFCEKAELEGAYIKLAITDDPLVTEEELREYKDECLTETDWLREYMCEFVVDETLAIIPEWDDRWIQAWEKDEFWGYYHKYVSMDIGTRDKTALLFAYYDFKSACLVILDEHCMSGQKMTTQDIAKVTLQKEKEHFLVPGKNETYKPYLRVADNNNLLLVQDLTTIHSIPFIATDKDELNRMVNKVRLWVRAGRIIIHPRCKELIGCLKTGIWKENRKEFDRSLVYGHYDAIASLIYLVRNIRENLNPIPADYGLNMDRHHIPPNLRENENAQKLRQMFKLNKKRR